MEGLLIGTPFADLVATAPGYDHLTLIDIGCSGGIHPGWRSFGQRLRAFAFDVNGDECARLQAAESLADVHYVHAFVRSSPGFPARRAAALIPSRHVWFRLSGPRMMSRRAARAAALTDDRRRELNLWRESALADPNAAVALPDFLRERKIADVDVIKIDVDGEDFAILNDFSDSLAGWGVLGLGLEVNFDGSEGDTEHSFHNTDRLMRSLGFDLFDLTIRRYSLAALPGVFAVNMPAETLTGRPQLGDAIDLRDLADPRHRDLAAAMVSGRLLKLAAIAPLSGVPDLAADLLLTHKDRFGGLIDVPHALDLLAAQVQDDTEDKLSYDAFMQAYEQDSPPLYRPTRAQALASRRSAMSPTSPPADETIQRLTAELDSMRRSKSWRVTAPLRALRQIVRPTPASVPAHPTSPSIPFPREVPVDATARQYGALVETLERLGHRPKGILHAGAHHGEQMELYLALRPDRIAWIEADPRCVDTLRRRVAAYRHAATEQTVIQALIADRDGETRSFYRFSNAGESSSLFRATDLLRQTWPGLDKTGEVLTLSTASLDSALRAHGAAPAQYDVMVLDLQGGELLGLQGAGAFLDAAEFLEVEISSKPYYAGGRWAMK